MRYAFSASVAAMALTWQAIAAPPEPVAGSPLPPLTLDEAITRAMSRSPDLRAAEARQRAAGANVQQAGTLPNPDLSIEAEDFGGTGSYKGFHSSQVTYGFSQQIIAWGKRDLLEQAARHEAEGAAFSAIDTQNELRKSITRAFAEVIGAQEAVNLAAETVDLAGKSSGSVQRRVAAAREPEIQQSKAEVSLAEARVALQTAQQRLLTARQSLALFWGGSPLFTADEQGYRELSPPPPLADLERRLTNQPAQQALAATIASRRASFEYEQRRNLPDPTISAGVRQEDTNDTAFVVGLSIPLPVFDRNQGNIERSRHEVVQAEAEREVAARSSHAQLLEAYNAIETDYQQAESLMQTVLPLAEKAYDQAESGYRAGRFAYLDVLDAQRTLTENRQALNEALKDYHLQRAEIDRLTASTDEKQP